MDTSTALSSIAAVGELPWSVQLDVRRILRASGNAWPRVELASVRHVLPVWTSLYPTTRLLAFLDLADDVVDGRGDATELQATVNELASLHQAELDRTTDLRVMDGPLMVLWAAIRAGGAVLGWDHDADGLGLDQIDPYDWSASFAASIAAAGGAIWDGKGDPGLRRAYWVWWLTEAVPSALGALQMPRDIR